MNGSVRFFVSAAGFAGGSALVGAMIGAVLAPAAYADDLDPVQVSDGPLHAAYLGAEQIEAAQALTPHDLPVVYDSLYDAQLPLEQNALDAFASTEALQLANAANITGFDNLIIGDIDQYYATSASEFSTAITSFESGDVTTTSAINLLSDDFQLENATSTLNFFDQIAPYLGIGSIDAASHTAASADAVPVTVTTPAELLSDAGTNYTDAGQLLSGLPAGSVGDYAPTLASATQFDASMLHGIANLGSAEAALSSYDNGELSQIVNPVFFNVDQGWDQASQAAVSASQAVESAVSSGSTTEIATAMLGISGPEFEALGPAIQAEFIDLAAHFLTGGDFTSIGDLASGMDPVTAIDPSTLADLLSSVGL